MAVEQAVAPPRNEGTGAQDELVCRLLPLIEAGSYVLTDPRGVITSWGVQAEALFGLTADQVLGRGVKATLTGSDDDYVLLVDQDAPTAVTVEVKAKDRDGKKCACELNVIPIRLRDGTAFSALVRHVEGAGAAADEATLAGRHADALAVLGRTLGGAQESGHDVRLAGVMVIVRPLAEVSWLAEARRAVLALRADRAPAAESRGELSAADAADRLARTAQLAERIDRVGRDTGEARRDAAGARAGAEAATRSLAAVEDRLAGIEARIGEFEPLAARVDALEEQLAAGTEAVKHREAEDSQEAGAALAVAEEARAQAASAVAEMKDARAQAVAAIAEMEEARAQAAVARESAEAASAAAAAATARAEEAAAQVLDARRELSEAGDRLVGRTEAGGGDSGGAAAGRDPIPGLDDVAAPVALLGLDGGFQHLNAAFAALVGYSEEQFRSASWPSLIDRDNRDDHRSLLEELRAGKREEGLIETFYTGGAGLLVPVAGRISLARDEQREPEHLRLEL
jgi:PAS domain S-box-containing protein